MELDISKEFTDAPDSFQVVARDTTGDKSQLGEPGKPSDEGWKPRVLIIDDDIAQCCTLEDILHLEGFEATTCVTGKKGLKHALTGDFDVIILDLRLPDLFGTRVLEEIALSETNPRVIIHTAFGSYDSAKDSVNFGAYAYVQKGNDPEELIRHVHRAAHDKIQGDLLASQSRYEALVEHGPQAVIVLEKIDDRQLRIIQANEKAKQFFHLVGDDFTEHNLDDLRYHTLTAEFPSMSELREHVNQALLGRIPVFEWILLDSEGREKPYEVRLSQYPSRNRRLVIGSLVDITQRRLAEQALRASEQRLRVLFDENPSMYLHLDHEGCITSINLFGASSLGYQSKELVGTKMLDLSPSNEQSTLQNEFSSCFSLPEILHRWELSLRHKNGEILWVRAVGRVVVDQLGENYLLMVCEDITETREMAEELSFLAIHDPLTSLINRREFARRLGSALSHAQSVGSKHALLYLDLDQFKIVNDTCGHSAGDELLRQLASVLQQQIRSRDTLARLGGDEFGVLLEWCSTDEALQIADSLRQAVESFRFLWADQSFSIAASIGIVAISDKTTSITEVLSAADAACYVAKDRGRNQIHLHHEKDATLSQRLGEMQWARRIHSAIEENALALHYQTIAPIKDDTNRGERFELLLRMQRPDGTLESAKTFLPAAERYSATTPIDRWVVDAALRWLESDPEFVRSLELCSINLSGHSLGNSTFLEFLTSRLDESIVPENKICFEITETAAICEMSKAIHFMSRLKARGCVFALDDFGSGLTSFGYLRTLPVDYLKIDGSFVKDILHDPLDYAVVRSINEIAQLMGKETVAEFVENKAILERITEIGVDFAQGYAVGRPQPIEKYGEHNPVCQT
ncbi:MAG: EAL domain-containing protein [bacterium]|nr:EAL domain-containing protein [bacterium]